MQGIWGYRLGVLAFTAFMVWSGKDVGHALWLLLLCFTGTKIKHDARHEELKSIHTKINNLMERD
jgi:hypothetical protein